MKLVLSSEPLNGRIFTAVGVSFVDSHGATLVGEYNRTNHQSRPLLFKPGAQLLPGGRDNGDVPPTCKRSVTHLSCQ